MIDMSQTNEITDRFGDFMVGRRVSQWNPISNKELDGECGCCMGAHLARFFAEDSPELCTGDAPPKNDRAVIESNDIEEYLRTNPEWWQDYVDYCTDKLEGLNNLHDIDEDDLIACDDIIDSWVEDRQTKYDFSGYDYDRGYIALYTSLKIPDNDWPFVDNILTYYAYDKTEFKGSARVSTTPWGHAQWETECPVSAIRKTLRTYEYWCREHRKPWWGPPHIQESQYDFIDMLHDGEHESGLVEFIVWRPESE